MNSLREISGGFDLRDSATDPQDIAGIVDRGDLAKSWIDTYRAAKRSPNDPNIDRKLGTLTRWLLKTFEASPCIRLIYVASRDFILRPGNGEILMDRLASAYDLAEVACPMDPEDVHPGEANVSPVAVDFACANEGSLE